VDKEIISPALVGEIMVRNTKGNLNTMVAHLTCQHSSRFITKSTDGELTCRFWSPVIVDGEYLTAEQNGRIFQLLSYVLL
jgi:hypothetical protein